MVTGSIYLFIYKNFYSRLGTPNIEKSVLPIEVLKSP